MTFNLIHLSKITGDHIQNWIQAKSLDSITCNWLHITWILWSVWLRLNKFSSAASSSRKSHQWRVWLQKDQRKNCKSPPELSLHLPLLAPPPVRLPWCRCAHAQLLMLDFGFSEWTTGLFVQTLFTASTHQSGVAFSNPCSCRSALSDALMETSQWWQQPDPHISCLFNEGLHSFRQFLLQWVTERQGRTAIVFMLVYQSNADHQTGSCPLGQRSARIFNIRD